jgi:hypothetical protein
MLAAFNYVIDVRSVSASVPTTPYVRKLYYFFNTELMNY